MSVSLSDLAQTLRDAGFDGVEMDGGVLYARADGPAAPEFTLTLTDAQQILAQRYSVRGSDAQRAAWMQAHPQARLTIEQGETQLTLTLPLAEPLAPHLPLWRDLMKKAAIAAIEWRRGQRPVYGM